MKGRTKDNPTIIVDMLRERTGVNWKRVHERRHEQRDRKAFHRDQNNKLHPGLHIDRGHHSLHTESFHRSMDGREWQEMANSM